MVLGYRFAGHVFLWMSFQLKLFRVFHTVMRIMLRILLRCWLVLMCGLGMTVGTMAAAHAADTNVKDSYRLGAGDEIAIRVFGEEDMDVKTRLGEAGTINFPLLGEIQVRGLTAGEMEQLIIKGLKGPYLIDPIVSVDITEYRPFFVNGEVNKPGAIPFQPGITLRKAIAMSGGFTERAKRDIADVISGNDPDSKPHKAGLDEMVRPGDIITIKQSFF